MSLDSYYLDLSHLEPAERAQRNFDAPDALDHAMLLEHLEALRRRETVLRPVYDFAQHTRLSRREPVAVSETVVVEGLFALYWKPIRELLDFKVFIT